MKLFYFILCCFVILLMASCEKLVEVEAPRSRLDKTDVFESDQTAVAAVSRLYTGPNNADGLAASGLRYSSYLPSLSSDELKVEAGEHSLPFYQNELSSILPDIESAWRFFYSLIYDANSVMEGLQNAKNLTPSLKNQLLGETKFIRAFCHFYLTGLFGDVPYISTTNYQLNQLAGRITVSEVYEKLATDLLEAKALLADDYSYSKNERVRVNKWAAGALLARVYLYKEDWVKAKEQASSVIAVTSLYELNTDLNKVFLKNSTEAIWQLIPPNPSQYTYEGLIYNQGSGSDVAMLTDGLLDAFEESDKRRDFWVTMNTAGANTWYIPFKYKETIANGTGAEYSTALRLSEQYLIRAEARANENKLSEAMTDVNVIRQRAGLADTTAITQNEALSIIEQERRVELFSEWGHRWLDLKRTGRATAVLSVVKTTWDAQDELYPIPYSELQLNPNMTQNPSY